MGQATVSPDPLDESTTTSIASADDLLAQLAGEEIDRLLAESEAERAATGASERAEFAPLPVVVPQVAPERADSRIEQVIPAEPVVASAPAQAPLAPQVPTPPEPAATVAAMVGVAAAPVEKHDLTADATATAAAAAERAALSEVLSAADTAGAHVEAELVLDEPQPLPLLLRPLEWLNAPLASCPEATREMLGKVAIVTLVNAIAVLAYVLMFRSR
jgi:hypothetical protein